MAQLAQLNFEDGNMTEKRYFVYELIDPRDYMIFYIGISDRERKNKRYRPYEHINEGKRFLKNRTIHPDKNHHKIEYIADLLEEGFEPFIYECFETDVLDDVLSKEKELIKLLGREFNYSGQLTNIASGGAGYRQSENCDPWNKGIKTGIEPPSKGTSGRTYEEILGPERAAETKKKQSDSQKRIGNKPPSAKGVKRSEEWCENHGNFWRGKPKTEEQKKKIANSLKGNVPWNKGLKGVKSKKDIQQLGDDQ